MLPRLQAVSTAPQSAIICEKSQGRPAGPFQAPPLGSPMAFPCLLNSTRSTSTALQARWIGTTTATSVEVTSGHGASHLTNGSKNSTRCFTRTSGNHVGFRGRCFRATQGFACASTKPSIFQSFVHPLCRRSMSMGPCWRLVAKVFARTSTKPRSTHLVKALPSLNHGL